MPLTKDIDYDRAVALVTAKISYVDTVAVWLQQPLTDGQRAALERECGSLNVIPKPMEMQPWWRVRITANQPSAKFLNLLAKIAANKYMINHVAIALDLCTATPQDAVWLKRYFEQHFFKAQHGKHRIGTCGDTHYSSRDRWVANSTGMYSDRPSKVTKTPCNHLEWRICTAQAVRAAGFNRLSDLAAPDYRAFWKKRLRLENINHVALGKRMTGQGRRKHPWTKEDVPGMPYDRFERIGHLVARMTAETLPDENVRELRDNVWFGLTKACLPRLDNTPFLPE